MKNSVMHTLVFSVAFVFADAQDAVYDFKKDLKTKICQQDKRYRTFRRALELMIERESKVILETGTSRKGRAECAGDGCSTVVFSDFAKRMGLKVYSVDIDPKAVEEAKGCLKDSLDIVEITAMDSVEYIENFEYPIDLLYLDSYDYDPKDPSPSQIHHLKEIIAAYPKLHEKSIVLIDDCDLPNGGKGKWVIEFLSKKGWKKDTKGYQIIMTR